MAAHEGVVRTAALIKRRFYWPKVQKDVEAWCKRCTTWGRCKAAMRGHGELQQPQHGAFNERVSVDLIKPLHRTDRGNEYIVVVQDHFTKWIEGAAVATKEAMLVADVIVHEWVYKHGTPLNLHSDRGTEFTVAMHQCPCDLLRIHKTYSTVYNPQSNGAVERCNRTLLSMQRTVVSEQQNDWDDHLPAALCAYRLTLHASRGVSPHKLVYGVEMTLPLDLMLGDTGPEQPEHECPYEYVEWIKDSLRRAHSTARKTLKTSAKCQHRGYRERNRIVRFHHGEWVWRAYPQQGGKLCYTNRGPWLVLAKAGPVMYKIQRHPQAGPEIVHVDKLMPYYPDFGERLHSWIETDCPTQYRDQEAQTSKPVLQDQTVAVVDIPLLICDPAPAPEPAEPHPNAPSLTKKAVETDETHTASPTKLEVQPAVLETPSDSTPGPDQELLTRSASGPETETDPILCPENVSDQMQPIAMDSDAPEADPEVEPADQYHNPSPVLSETSTGSRSLVPLPRRGTRSRKQLHRYTLIRRLQVLPVTQAQNGSSVWLFPIIGIAVTLSKSFPSLQ